MSKTPTYPLVLVDKLCYVGSDDNGESLYRFWGMRMGTGQEAAAVFKEAQKAIRNLHICVVCTRKAAKAFFHKMIPTGKWKEYVEVQRRSILEPGLYRLNEKQELKHLDFLVLTPCLINMERYYSNTQGLFSPVERFNFTLHSAFAQNGISVFTTKENLALFIKNVQGDPSNTIRQTKPGVYAILSDGKLKAAFIDSYIAS